MSGNFQYANGNFNWNRWKAEHFNLIAEFYFNKKPNKIENVSSLPLIILNAGQYMYTVMFKGPVVCGT